MKKTTKLEVRKVTAIFGKQIKDTLKNKTVLIQFVMFPVLSIIMENTIKVAGMPEHFFITLFAAMYIGMAPLTSMAAIISEEKEMNTLRVLLLANVKPQEYLLGVGSYVWICCMIGAAVMGLAGNDSVSCFMKFLGIMALGITTSLLIGAAIGTFCKNQMSATSITVPVMMVFSFLPMISMFNSTVEKAAKFTYSQQISILLGGVASLKAGTESAVVIAVNMILAGCLFVYAYRKSGLA